MITEKLAELKEKSSLTNQQISELSGVPLSTVTRIFSDQTDNPSFQTINDIVSAMGGSLDEVTGNISQKQSAEKEDVHEKLIKLYQDTLAHKNKWIRTLFICLCIVMGVLLFIVLFDILNPQIGFVKY